MRLPDLSILSRIDMPTLIARMGSEFEWVGDQRYFGIVKKDAPYEKDMLGEGPTLLTSALPFHVQKWLPRGLVRGMADYFDHVDKQGLMVPTSEETYQVKRRVLRSDPFADLLMHQYTRLVSALLHKNLRPSYSFMSRYLKGSALGVHTDVPSCPVNVSLQIARNGSTSREAWPLFVAEEGPDPAVVHEFHMEDGDAVIYLGTKQPHWRPIMPVQYEVR